MPRRMRAARSAESVPAIPPGTISRRSPCADEPPCTFGHQVLAPLGKQAQHLGCGLGIDRGQALVARGGQGGGEGIEAVVLAGVFRSIAPEPLPRVWAARPPPTRLPLPTSPPGTDRGRRRSPAPNGARGTASPSARRLSGRSGSAGRKHARGAHLWLRRPQRRRPTSCGDRPQLAPS